MSDEKYLSTYDILKMHEKGAIDKAVTIHLIQSTDNKAFLAVAGTVVDDSIPEEGEKKKEDYINRFDVGVGMIMQFIEEELPARLEAVFETKEGQEAIKEVIGKPKPNLEIVKIGRAHV